MSFRFDMKDKTPQQRAIVAQREESNRLLINNLSSKPLASCQKNVFSKSIIMKLAMDGTGRNNGLETLRIYENFIRSNNSVWFSTNALYRGMAQKQVDMFSDAIKSGLVVFIYFAVGKQKDNLNDIVYRAEIIDIVSDSSRIPSPENLLTPSIWANFNCTIWIKIKELTRYNSKSAQDFRIISTKARLSDVIEKSQFHFGYVEEMI